MSKRAKIVLWVIGIIFAIIALVICCIATVAFSIITEINRARDESARQDAIKQEVPCGGIPGTRIEYTKHSYGYDNIVYPSFDNILNDRNNEYLSTDGNDLYIRLSGFLADESYLGKYSSDVYFLQKDKKIEYVYGTYSDTKNEIEDVKGSDLSITAYEKEYVHISLPKGKYRVIIASTREPNVEFVSCYKDAIQKVKS